MANINKVYLLFSPSQSNENIVFNSTDNESKKDKNIFRYFDTNTGNSNNTKKIAVEIKIKNLL